MELLLKLDLARARVGSAWITRGKSYTLLASEFASSLFNSPRVVIEARTLAR